MHTRAAVLQSIRLALASTASPGHAVFEEEETAITLPCFQYATPLEVPGEDDAKGRRARVLTLRATARAATLAGRETLAEELELALLVDLAATFEVVLRSTELVRSGEGAEKNYAATYVVDVVYFTDRDDPAQSAD